MKVFSTRIIIQYFIFAVCVFLVFIHADAAPPGTKRDVKTKEKGRIFIINAPVKDIEDFKQLVKQALQLKPYGTVRVNISTIADKGFHEIPKKGSPWHEYASANPTPSKFFPDPKLIPFIPAEFVQKNRKLLFEKAKILRENGLEAAFIGYEPNFLPVAFFEAHPEMLGPRVDHPRRSTQKEFAPCIHAPETQQMYIRMMTELLKNVPEIKTFSFKTNDAGAGICWAEWLYTGPNGPSGCKNFTMGETVKLLLSTYQKGAAKAGHELSIYLDEGSSNFSDEEKKDIQNNLPENCFYGKTESRDIEVINSSIAAYYPVTGIVNPVSMAKSVAQVRGKENNTVFVTFRAAYDRGMERLHITNLYLDLLKRSFDNASSQDQLAGALMNEWVGSRYKDTLLKALTLLNEATAYKSENFPRVSTLYWGVTARLVNRPLVIVPQLLSEQEERYFLPYIFNVSGQEGRMDYMDIHGVHQNIKPGVIEVYVQKIKQSAAIIESISTNTPARKYLTDMALALRMHACIVRSCGNFAAAQDIRDRDSALLAGEATRPNKMPTWTGHPDFIAFNNIMREELDNTQEFIALLQRGGQDLLVYAKNPVYEDRFILGPDLPKQLKQKRKVMLAHWQDIENYLSSPFK